MRSTFKKKNKDGGKKKVEEKPKVRRKGKPIFLIDSWVSHNDISQIPVCVCVKNKLVKIESHITYNLN